MQKEKHKLQIFKFGMYGLLKNLRFFEPFLLLYLIQSGLNLFEIGLLYSIREATMYIFEIPSGVIADRYGKKNELIMCFVFYIISFVVFFIGSNFVVFVIAIILYGLGEAFRSGTHKAMIMSYLDRHEISDSKSKVYGLTRSYSLIGSFISSISAALLVLFIPDLELLFIIAIVPYALDLLLIASYPSYLNERIDRTFNFKNFLHENWLSIKYVFTELKLRRILVNSSSYNGMFKILKDYIQPIIVVASASLIVIGSLSEEENTRIYIGLMYGVIYLFSALVTRNAYRLTKTNHPAKIINITWIATTILLFTLGIFIEQFIVVALAFLVFYALLNIRKPLMVEQIGNHSEETKRASVLSIESQMTSVFIIIFAPLIGFISDQYGLHIMFYGVVVLLIIAYPFIGKVKTKREV